MNKITLENLASEANYFSFFANCFLVKGVTRAIICDVLRGEIDFIPLEIYDLIQNFKDQPISQILLNYDEEDVMTISEYFLYFLDREYIMITADREELSRFPPIKLEWDTPNIIENAIVDVSTKSTHNFRKIAIELNNLGCEALQVRFFDSIGVEMIRQILNEFENKRIEHINLIIKYEDFINEEVLTRLLSDYIRVSTIIIHSCNNTNLTSRIKIDNYPIFFLSQKIVSSSHCGFVSPQNFNLRLDFFIESKIYNNCLNKKISIDEFGEIKNCPAMESTYGNHLNVSLLDVALDEKFKEIWKINKDLIDICKVCEFRYICTDCRAIVSDPTNFYSKPLKCKYDPFTGEWN